MAHDVFISCASKDKPTAEAVCAVLESQGIRCWVAPRNIRPGKNWGESIIEAIRSARVMVLVFSGHANESPQIQREVERAVNRELTIIPFRIENVLPNDALEYFISTPHWLDAFTPPLDPHLQYLAQVIRHVLDEPVANAAAGAPADSERLEENRAAAADAEAALKAEEARSLAEKERLAAEEAERVRRVQEAEVAKREEEARQAAAAEADRQAEAWRVQREKAEAEAEAARQAEKRRIDAEKAEQALRAEEKKAAELLSAGAPKTASAVVYNEPPAKPKRRSLKAALVILVLAVLGGGYYAYQSYAETQRAQSEANAILTRIDALHDDAPAVQEQETEAAVNAYLPQAPDEYHREVEGRWNQRLAQWKTARQDALKREQTDSAAILARIAAFPDAATPAQEQELDAAVKAYLQQAPATYRPEAESRWNQRVAQWTTASQAALKQLQEQQLKDYEAIRGRIDGLNDGAPEIQYEGVAAAVKTYLLTAPEAFRAGVQKHWADRNVQWDAAQLAAQKQQQTDHDALLARIGAFRSDAPATQEQALDTAIKTFVQQAPANLQTDLQSRWVERTAQWESARQDTLGRIKMQIASLAKSTQDGLTKVGAAIGAVTPAIKDPPAGSFGNKAFLDDATHRLDTVQQTVKAAQDGFAEQQAIVQTILNGVRTGPGDTEIAPADADLNQLSSQVADAFKAVANAMDAAKTELLIDGLRNDSAGGQKQSIDAAVKAFLSRAPADLQAEVETRWNQRVAQWEAARQTTLNRMKALAASQLASNQAALAKIDTQLTPLAARFEATRRDGAGDKAYVDDMTRQFNDVAAMAKSAQSRFSQQLSVAIVIMEGVRGNPDDPAIDAAEAEVNRTLSQGNADFQRVDDQIARMRAELTGAI